VTTALAAWSVALSDQLLQPPPQETWAAALEAWDASSILEHLDGLQRLPLDTGLLSQHGQAVVLELMRRPWQPAELECIRSSADQRRRQLVGDRVSYVVNRNLNFSNHCVKHCSFCAFRRDPGESGAYWLTVEDLQRRAGEAQARGATELCLQGGLNPAARLDRSATAYAEALLQALQEAAPGIHLHAFSPQELLFFAQQDRITLLDVLSRLKAAGLGSVPGTAAEVLSERVRAVLCPEKLSARHWVAVVLEVMAQGLAATSTLMAGHIEQPADRAAHLLTLVAIQHWARAQGLAGFSEFVLLPFVGEAAPAPLRRRVGRDQPDRTAMLLLTAQARLVLDAWIPHHQPSWVKLTLPGAAEALRWGCDDLGGTLMEEHITTMAGARGGTAQSPAALEAVALAQGRLPWQRTTLYRPVDCPTEQPLA
jgi:5-amino-6-(D-ribitylamino)uracil---L-tyrosine 4-hydroxyphenyl transferase